MDEEFVLTTGQICLQKKGFEDEALALRCVGRVLSTLLSSHVQLLHAPDRRAFTEADRESEWQSEERIWHASWSWRAI